MPSSDSTVYLSCTTGRAGMNGTVNRKRVLPGRLVKYELRIDNRLERTHCMDHMGLQVDLPPELAFRRSSAYFMAMFRNGSGLLASRTPSEPRAEANCTISGDGSARPNVTVAADGSTTILWSGFSLRPNRVGRFFVKTRVVSGPGGQPSGVVNITASVFQYSALCTPACKRVIGPTPVRLRS